MHEHKCWYISFYQHIVFSNYTMRAKIAAFEQKCALVRTQKLTRKHKKKKPHKRFFGGGGFCIFITGCCMYLIYVLHTCILCSPQFYLPFLCSSFLTLSLVQNQSALRSAHQLYCSLFCHVCPSTKWHTLLGVVQKSYQLVPEDWDRTLWAGYSIMSGCVTLRACRQSHCLSIPLLRQRAGVMLTLFDFGIMARI